MNVRYSQSKLSDMLDDFVMHSESITNLPHHTEMAEVKQKDYNFHRWIIGLTHQFKTPIA